MRDFPWYKSYPEGIPHDIGAYEYNSLIDLFDTVCVKYGERTAFENMGVRLTFKELHVKATSFAAYLQQGLGLKKGDRIAIQMPNVLQFPVAFFGAIKAGLIVVNTNPLYTPPEMKHQFNNAGVSAVVIMANFAHQLEVIKSEITAKHIIITHMGDMLGTFKGGIVDFVVKYIKKMIPPYHIPGAVPFKSVLKSKAKYTKPSVDIEDVTLLQYTGGTTGVSKGAQLSHRNLIAHNQMIAHWFKSFMRPDQEDIIITAIPLYHIFALTVNGLLMLSTGVKNVLITNPRDMPGFVKELGKHKFTIITGVNTLFNGLLHNPGFKDLDFSRLAGAVGGGMAVQDAVAKRWEETTGKPLAEGYGLSETSPVLCCNPLNGTHRRGTIGIPVPSTEVAIMDDEGNPLPQGETGEICARGPQVMRGYWQSDNTGVFFPGGWFKTGDVGYMNEQGFFRIVDRKKDMIKVSGFNVFPNEIENVIAGNPKVLEVAAIGVPHEKSGEAIKVFVVRKDESLTEEELIAFCHASLTNYKVPRFVVFVKEIPKSNVGKILRRVLKENGDTKAG